MHKTIAVIAASVLLSSPSFGANASRWHGSNGERVIWHNGTTRKVLGVGENDIDGNRKFSCTNPTGCMVIVSASIYEAQTNGIGTTCAYVDGIGGAPGCNQDQQASIGNRFISTLHEHFRVAAGSHSVKTTVTLNSGNVTMLGWAIDYTIYDQPN